MFCVEGSILGLEGAGEGQTDTTANQQPFGKGHEMVCKQHFQNQAVRFGEIIAQRLLYPSGFNRISYFAGSSNVMTIQEKVKEKEQSVRALLDALRLHLNSKRQAFDKAPQSWEYISTLGITETRLKELIDYLNEKV